MSVIELNDRRPIDPTESQVIKDMLSDWYSRSIGGTDAFSPVVMSSFVGNAEQSGLVDAKLRNPRMALVIQPLIAAWARDEICNLDYLKAALPPYPRSIIREWCLDIHDHGGCTIRIEKDEPIYLPTRMLLYRALEVIMQITHYCEALTDAHAEALAIIKKPVRWKSQNAPINAEMKETA